ncbi:MAG: proteasome assembly chaperone family protein [Halobacteriaceae archaeon]
MARVIDHGVPDMDEPILVEGLPGVGLVGKIAADHLVDELSMSHAASVRCDGLPEVAIYGADDRAVQAPVRIYADADRELLVLQSDVPVSRTAASDFASCIVGWIDTVGAFPLFLSGLPVEDLSVDEVPTVYGVATGEGAARLDTHDIDTPPERGLIGGPTGALLYAASAEDVDGAGLVVESDPQFPDPAAARSLLVGAITPLADIDVSTEALVEQSEQIRESKERLAQQMQEAEEAESSQARPLRMYQ